ncbi:hypothetical protein BD410DRAFT_841822 [Rickenella mellea]|uniref:Uncharacterized protein n=1 Tax=Rickenella mellea TaxID=50990 RepID=A0A4Y7PZB0_9AGAM|nr:hypothetical protein BD410DRAFT_841822 [Rickenella mellea]
MSTSTQNTPRHLAVHTYVAKSGVKHTARDTATARKPQPNLLSNYSRFFEGTEGRLAPQRVELASTDARSIYTPIPPSTIGTADRSERGTDTVAGETRSHHGHSTPQDEPEMKRHSRSDQRHIREPYSRYHFSGHTCHADEGNSDHESGVLVERTNPKWVGEGSRKLRKAPPKARMPPHVSMDGDIREDPSRPLPRRPERKEDGPPRPHVLHKEKRERRASKRQDGPTT